MLVRRTLQYHETSDLSLMSGVPRSCRSVPGDCNHVCSSQLQESLPQWTPSPPDPRIGGCRGYRWAMLCMVGQPGSREARSAVVEPHVRDRNLCPRSVAAGFSPLHGTPGRRLTSFKALSMARETALAGPSVASCGLERQEPMVRGRW